jgi:hypothetical protein
MRSFSLLCGLVVRVPACRSSAPGVDSRRYQIFWVVLCLERDPLRLMRIIEVLLESKISGCRLDSRRLTSWGPVALTTRHSSTLNKLVLTSPTSDDRSVGIVRMRTKGHEVCCFILMMSFKTCALRQMELERRSQCGRADQAKWNTVREDECIQVVGGEVRWKETIIKT